MELNKKNSMDKKSYKNKKIKQYSLIDKIYGFEINKLLEIYKPPFFLYDKEKIIRKVKSILTCFNNYPHFKLNFTVKSNNNIQILKIFKELNLGLDVSSVGEIYLALKAGFKPEQISLTGPSFSINEFKYIIGKKIRFDADSLTQLKIYGKLNPGSEVGIRIKPDVDSGFHPLVNTGGKESRFGIDLKYLEHIKTIAGRYNLKIICIHVHIGSGNYDYSPYIKALNKILKIAESFKDVKKINLGGGVACPSIDSKSKFDFTKFSQVIKKIINDWNKKNNKKIELELEYGEYLLMDSGCLFTNVMDIKETSLKKFVYVDVSTNLVQAPIIFGISSYPLYIYRRKRKAEYKTSEFYSDIVGNTCFSGDKIYKDIKLPDIKRGDIFILGNTGAYCFCRATIFNCRLIPLEIIIEDKKVKLIRKKMTLKSLLRDQVI